MNIIRHHDLDAAQRDARPHYIGLDRPFALPACSGNCDQGRKPCITPEACRLPDDEAKMGDGAGVFVWPAVMALALFAVLAVVHLWSAA